MRYGQVQIMVLAILLLWTASSKLLHQQEPQINSYQDGLLYSQETYAAKLQ